MNSLSTRPACHGPGAKLPLASVASGSGPADIAIEDPLFQSRPVPAPSFADRFRAVAGRRALGLGLTLLIEVLLLLLLLSLGTARQPGTKEGAPTVVSFIPEEAPEPASPEPERRAEERPATERPEPERPQPPRPVEPAAVPPPIVILPTPFRLPPSTAIPRSNVRPAPPARPVYGPPDVRSPAMRDTERVGTAPNGEPLYAAEWYREPEDAAMRAYLSTAHGPGWGLIACRTAPDYRVEDCVALQEYPEGSQINRSVLAAAWEFRVRPPRLGGRPLIGAWVRIRISYDMERR
jgi:protein TonB